METSSITTENVDFLDDLFPQFRPRLSKIEYIGVISVFSFYFERATDLHEHWKNMTNTIAAYYQSGFEAEESAFERWNIYLFFLVKEPVRSQLKVRIENNKFSSRKIVQDQIPEDYPVDLIHQLINEHIINNDLDFSTGASREKNHFERDSDIYRIIANSGIQASGKSVAVNKNELENLYQKIIQNV